MSAAVAVLVSAASAEPPVAAEPAVVAKPAAENERAARLPVPRPIRAMQPEGETAAIKPASRDGGAQIMNLADLGSVSADTPIEDDAVVVAQNEAVSGAVRTKEKKAVDFGPAVTIAGSDGGSPLRPSLVPITVRNQVSPTGPAPTTSITVDIATPYGGF